MNTSKRPNECTIDRARLRAALAVCGKSFSALAVEAHVSHRHLELVVAGRRPLPPRLAAALADALGPAAWAFVTGRTDTLAAAPAAGGHGLAMLSEASPAGADRGGA
jgi:lambda repressor-like predicted transcriptional regulator